MKKYIVYLSFLFFSTGVIVGAEKPFVSQPSELSAESIQTMPPELLWNIIKQLKMKPEKALEKIEEFKLVSKKFRESTNNPQFKRLIAELYAKVYTEKYKNWSGLLLFGSFKNLKNLLDKEFQAQLISQKIYQNLTGWQSAYNWTILNTAISLLRHQKDSLKKYTLVVDSVPVIFLEKKIEMGYTPLEHIISYALEESEMIEKTGKIIEEAEKIGDAKKIEKMKEKKKERTISYDRHLKAIEYLLKKGVSPSITGLKSKKITKEIANLLKKYGGNPEDV